MTKRVAVYGGSFNPPGRHHQRIAEVLSARFDEVRVVPCGPRPDKQTTNDVDPVYRAAMTDLAFRGTPGVRVELFDLEGATFTRTHALQERFASAGELWHVVRREMVEGGETGTSQIQREWEEGERLWAELNFVVVVGPGEVVSQAGLPPKCEVLEVDRVGSSVEIRERIFKRKPIGDVVSPGVARYLERYGLYRSRIPNRATRWFLEEDPRLLIECDPMNPKAREWARAFEKYAVSEDPNCILVLGGDGSMLRAIRRHWRRRVPLFGINAGHRGFLLNDIEEVRGGTFPPPELVVRQLPLLYVELQTMTGRWKRGYAFNDAWMERSSGQSVWLEVQLNGKVRLTKLVADGALLCTAAGSTAYARSMGATPLLADTPGWMMVGSNVMQPPQWGSALLSMDAQVELRGLNLEKRPLAGFLDGLSQGPVQALRARVSRAATVELAFHPSHDMAEKITQLQFPDGRVER